MALNIRRALKEDCTLVLTLIRELAEYERLLHEVVADEETLHRTLFSERPFAEVLIAEIDGAAVGFALFFTNYSTFLGKPGLYLEDLFVRPEARRKGVGAAMMAHVARICVERDYGRFEWSVLDWNEQALKFYAAFGAQPQSDWTKQRLVGEPLKQLAARYSATRSE